MTLSITCNCYILNQACTDVLYCMSHGTHYSLLEPTEHSPCACTIASSRSKCLIIFCNEKPELSSCLQPCDILPVGSCQSGVQSHGRSRQVRFRADEAVAEAEQTTQAAAWVCRHSHQCSHRWTGSTQSTALQGAG